ncbi:hypothetical protein [Acetobacter ghanensis]|uniref:Uncharacterized protein n=1 Tax=Acetobacter ghanensis TaxID=431306 RepID=A0ABX0KPD5_9PROT|nr:hypothetical protein [Acetobacter ghanensis]NHO40324.1 hypothetical protein [Acetobacter ghanensis]
MPECAYYPPLLPDSYSSTLAVLKANGLSSNNAYAVAELIHSSPQNRETLSVNWTRGKWSVSVEEMRYGSSVFIAALTSPPICGYKSSLRRPDAGKSPEHQS